MWVDEPSVGALTAAVYVAAENYTTREITKYKTKHEAFFKAYWTSFFTRVHLSFLSLTVIVTLAPCKLLSQTSWFFFLGNALNDDEATGSPVVAFLNDCIQCQGRWIEMIIAANVISEAGVIYLRMGPETIFLKCYFVLFCSKLGTRKSISRSIPRSFFTVHSQLN